jgi:hypothetical protein
MLSENPKRIAAHEIRLFMAPGISRMNAAPR